MEGGIRTLTGQPRTRSRHVCPTYPATPRGLSPFRRRHASWPQAEELVTALGHIGPGKGPVTGVDPAPEHHEVAVRTVVTGGAPSTRQRWFSQNSGTMGHSGAAISRASAEVAERVPWIPPRRCRGPASRAGAGPPGPGWGALRPYMCRAYKTAALGPAIRPRVSSRRRAVRAMRSRS